MRATVKIDGVHKNDAREWLPFSVRLYFYAGAQPVRLVHTIVFDGDHEKDFIKGLGVAFTIPMREQVHNRHVRFSGEGDGLWSEPAQPLTGRRFLPGNPYASQLAGKRIANKETFNAAGQKLMTDWAVWDDFKLAQTTADGFTIQKRTNPESCWLDAIGGRRSSGLVFAGDVSGGLAVGVKNFWQSHPASLEVRRATSPAAELRVWLWSPEAPAMDLRHYDTKAHDLDSSYEDVQPGFSTPHGVARTSELTLFPSGDVPSKEETSAHARLSQAPPLLVAPPEHLHSTGVFGIWSLPDRSTAAKKALEDQLDSAFDFYRKEVDQRHWYGFWNFGDVMHQHDGARHEWRYDMGGYAWDNTELGTDHVALVQVPALRPRRRVPHGGSHDAPHQRGRHLPPRALRHARVRATTCGIGAAAPKRRASRRRPTAASTTTSPPTSAPATSCAKWSIPITRRRRSTPCASRRRSPGPCPIPAACAAAPTGWPSRATG